MKRLVLVTVILIGLVINAQTVVFEKQFGDSIKVIKYKYLEKSNKLVLGYESKNIDRKSILVSVDYEGKKEEILKDEFDKFSFSSTENAVCLIKTLKGTPFKSKHFSIENKKSTEYVKGRINYDFFTSKYILDLVNSSGYYKVNLYKDDAYFIKKSFTEGIEKSIKITKPEIETFADPKNPKQSDFAFQNRLVDETTFELVSKRTSLINNINTCTLYRTQYNLDGKIINKYKYEYNIPKGLFLLAGTKSNFENKLYSFGSDLAYYNSLDVNEYFIDNDTKDVFIYGMAVDKENYQPIAFYVTRFKKTGELIWNKFYEVDDKRGFNSDKRSTNLSIRMDEYMNNNSLVLSIQGDYSSYKNRYNHFFLIDKQTGNIVDKKDKDVDLEGYKGTLTSDKNHTIFNALELEKNRFVSINVILAASFNKKIEDLISQNANRKEVHYDAILSKKGVWILESDNKTYFKVTLFKE